MGIELDGEDVGAGIGPNEDIGPCHQDLAQPRLRRSDGRSGGKRVGALDDAVVGEIRVQRGAVRIGGQQSGMGDQPRGFANPCEAGVDALVDAGERRGEEDAGMRRIGDQRRGAAQVGQRLEGREGLAVVSALVEALTARRVTRQIERAGDQRIEGQGGDGDHRTRERRPGGAAIGAAHNPGVGRRNEHLGGPGVGPKLVDVAIGGRRDAVVDGGPGEAAIAALECALGLRSGVENVSARSEGSRGGARRNLGEEGPGGPGVGALDHRTAAGGVKRLWIPRIGYEIGGGGERG